MHRDTDDCPCTPETLQPEAKWRAFAACPHGLLWRRDFKPDPVDGVWHPSWRLAQVDEHGRLTISRERLTPEDVARGLYPDRDVRRVDADPTGTA